MNLPFSYICLFAALLTSASLALTLAPESLNSVEARIQVHRSAPSPPIKKDEGIATIVQTENPPQENDAPQLSHEPAETDNNIITFVALTSMTFLLASMTQWLIQRLSLPLPPSVGIFLVGMSISVIASVMKNPMLRQGVKFVENMDHRIFYCILLPISLYDGASNINFQTFRSVSFSALLLAGPGLMLNTFMIGVFLHYAVGGAFSWSVALLVGSVLSATDPVAVVAALRDARAPGKLAVILEGESLLNDGTAGVVFEILLTLILGRGADFKLFLQDCIRLAVIGPLLGFIGGVFLYSWFTTIQAHFEIQVTAVVGAFYFLSAAAEHYFAASSILTVVTFGLTVAAFGKAGFARSTGHVHETFISVLGTLSNQSLFLLVGMLTTKFMMCLEIRRELFINTILLFLVVSLSRLVVLYSMNAILRLYGKAFTHGEIVVLFWGALRGGVALALGIVLDSETHLPLKLRHEGTFYIATFTLLSLIVYGPTFKTVYRWSSVATVSSARRKFVEKAMAAVENDFEGDVEYFREFWFAQPRVLKAVLDSKILPDLTAGYMDRTGQFRLQVKSLHGVFESKANECAIAAASIAASLTLLEPHESASKESSSKDVYLGQSGRLSLPKAAVLNIRRSENLHQVISRAVESGGQRGGVDSGRPSQTNEVLNVAIHSEREVYGHMFMEHAIGGEALLILQSAADVGLSAVSSSCEDAFRKQWRCLEEHLQEDLWMRRSALNVVYPIRRHTFANLSCSIEVLFGFITARGEVYLNTESSEGEKQKLLSDQGGANLTAMMRQSIHKAQDVLSRFIVNHPKMATLALMKILLQILIYKKTTMVEEVKNREIILDTDSQKIVDILKQQLAKVIYYVPSYGAIDSSVPAIRNGRASDASGPVLVNGRSAVV